jgi:ribosomal protein S3AE
MIRTLMGKVVSSTAGNMTLPELINNIIQGEMAKNIFKECKPIYPIKRIEIRKSEVMSVPANLPKEEGKVKSAEEAPKEGAAVSPEQVPPSPTETKTE